MQIPVDTRRAGRTCSDAWEGAIARPPAADEIGWAELRQVPIGQDQKTVKPGINEGGNRFVEIADLKGYR